MAALALLVSLLFPGPIQGLEEDLRIDFPRLGSDDVIELDAELLTYDRRARRAEAEGEVRLGVRDLELTADRMILDLDGRFASAEGEVLLVYGARRILSERLWLELDGERAIAEDSILTVVDPHTGRLRLRLSAGKLERVSRDLLLVERLSYTACDCPEKSPPSWSLTARSARIRPDRGAWLIGSTFRIRGAPVLPLPIFYLPLGDRRSGLLAPRFGYSGQNGLRLALPLYLVLGPSWDLTLTAGLFSGLDTWENETPVRPGVRGFDQTLELRWAPASRSRGVLVATHLFDLNRDLADPAAPSRGSRGTLRASHTSRFDGGGFGVAGHGVHASVNLLSDAALAADLQPTLEQAQRGYVRSSMRGHLTLGDRLSVEMGSRWLQDVRQRFLGTVAGQDLRVRPLFGEGAPDTALILPMVYSGIPTIPVAGSLGARTDLRLVSWQRPFGGEDRLPSTIHARAKGELSHPILLGDALAGRASAGLTADLWRLGPDEDPNARAYPSLEVSLHTGLERRFQSVAHRVRPGMRWRLVPVVGGDAPDAYLDVFERALPEGGLHQLFGSVANELWSGGRRTLLATLSQGWDARSEALADLELELSLTPPTMPHRLDGFFAWDWGSSRLSFAGATGQLVGEGGATINARWIWVQPEGSTRLLSGIDEIFAGGALPAPPLSALGASINEVVLGVSAPRFRGLGLRYDVSMDISDSPRPPQHRARVTYQSVCRCWSGYLTATWPPGQLVPEFLVGVELAGIGSVTTRRGGI